MGGIEDPEEQVKFVLPLTEALADDVSPEGFELYVKDQVKAWGQDLQDLDVRHLETIEGVDGDYTIDVTARFRALGMRFLCLFECKRLKRPVERGDVQQLYVKMQSIGAQKGVVVSRSGFQEGAQKFARKHGIAIVCLIGTTASFLVDIAMVFHR